MFRKIALSKMRVNNHVNSDHRIPHTQTNIAKILHEFQTFGFMSLIFLIIFMPRSAIILTAFLNPKKHIFLIYILVSYFQQLVANFNIFPLFINNKLFNKEFKALFAWKSSTTSSI